MSKYLEQFRNAHPRTKSFILNVVYLFLLILISTVWAYWHLIADRTEIPKKEVHTHQ